MITGTTRYEKRNPNPSGLIPEWIQSSCTQCNQCIFVCPHAAIRPFVVTKEEIAAAPFPKEFEVVKATGSEFAGKKYAIRVSPLDCTGCNACVEACPEAPKALKMKSIDEDLEKNKANWDYAYELPDRGELTTKTTVRGSQFQTPLMEFSGACAVSITSLSICASRCHDLIFCPCFYRYSFSFQQGCGETPYFKLLTQLFGERMLIANATGCSTIWGGSFPS